MMSDIDVRGVLPWTALGQRWGHSWHSMCSYLGAFPPSLARSIILLLSSPSDYVMDPFSGRGTTLVESRLLGRIPIASDLNPIALALTRAKNTSVTKSKLLLRIKSLKQGYDGALFLPEAQIQSDAIQLIFHQRTLAQLCYLKRRLVGSNSEEDHFLLGALLGVMHGSERQDGSSMYASICMPNTFSMSPNYVRRYVETKGLNRTERDVFAILENKIGRLFQDPPIECNRGLVVAADAKHLADHEDFSGIKGRVRLIITSPPYLDIVNYAKQNWIRNWLLQSHPESRLVDLLDDNLAISKWLEFAEKVISQMEQFLSDKGSIVLVIGDVDRTSNSSISLARELIRRLYYSKRFKYIGYFQDQIPQKNKMTRIWSETKGNATNVDRIIILSQAEPLFHSEDLASFLKIDEKDCKMDPAYLSRNAQSFAGV